MTTFLARCRPQKTTFLARFMKIDSELNQTIYKNVEDYRRGFAYIKKKVEKLPVTTKKLVEKELKKYFQKCEKLEMIPNSQDCLDILNEVKTV